MELREVLTHLNGVKGSGGKYTALCPAHSDKHSSLSIKETNDKILIHCFAGCSFSEVVQAMGLSQKDFFKR